jgi:hypothetical protein
MRSLRSASAPAGSVKRITGTKSDAFVRPTQNDDPVRSST